MSTDSESSYSVAHEFGHTLSWSLLGLTYVPYGVQDFHLCFPGEPSTTAWSATSRESEKVAFWEGFAIAMQAMWLYKRDTANNVKRGNESIETPDPLECSMSNFGHNKALCNAALIWDFYDSPATGEDDHIFIRDLDDIFLTLAAYPDGCFFWADNNCSNEGGLEGMNARDFKANFDRWENHNDIVDFETAIFQNGVFLSAQD